MSDMSEPLQEAKLLRMPPFVAYVGLFGNAGMASLCFGLYTQSLWFGLGVLSVLTMIITLVSVVAESIEKARRN